KVRRLSSFFNLTKAPLTGAPDAFLITPCTPVVFCAHNTWMQTTTAAKNTATFKPQCPDMVFSSFDLLRIIRSSTKDARNTESQFTGEFEIGRFLHLKSEIQNLKLNFSPICDFGFRI